MYVCIGHQVGRVFANGRGDRGSVPGRVIPKIQKMVLDTVLFNIQHYTYLPTPLLRQDLTQGQFLSWV